MKIGYIRVSTEEQNTARQEVLLRELGVDESFHRQGQRQNAGPPGTDRMMNYVRRGDTVIVESISRFARKYARPARPCGAADRKAGGICKPQGGHRHDHANRQVHAHRIRGYCRTGARVHLAASARRHRNC